MESQMAFTEFGASGIETSRMGLGLAALGRPGYINLGHGQDLKSNYVEENMEARTHDMLTMAYYVGIRYFDTAQSYGKAELFLSNWLTENHPQNVVVGTKWGYYYTANWQVNAETHEIKEHTVSRLKKQWPESRQRLNPYLKIYQIHSATLESGVLDNKEVLKALEKIKDDGYVIGLSVSGPEQNEVVKKALSIVVNEERLFGAVQVTYNLLETSAETSMKKAFDAGLGVIVKEGLANGLLTARNSQANYFPPLQRMGLYHEVGEDAIALAFALSKPFVNVVLSGAATPDHLAANLKAFEVDFSNKELQGLETLCVPAKDYWEVRSRLQWN